MTPREASAALWRTRQEAVTQVRIDVAAEYGLQVADLLGVSKVLPLPEARREVMTRLWERGLNLSEIAKLLGHDPSTVHKAVRKSMGDTYATLTAGPGRVRQPAADKKEAAE